MPGTINFKPIEANLTHNTDLIGKMNPYCTFANGENIFQSQICKHGGKQPHWADMISVPIQGTESTILVELMDKDRITKDDTIGCCTVNVQDVQAEGTSTRWYPLFYKNEPAGEILLEASFNSGELQNQDCASEKLPQQEELITEDARLNASADTKLPENYYTGTTKTGLAESYHIEQPREEALHSQPAHTGSFTRDVIEEAHVPNKTFIETTQIVEPRVFTKCVDIVETVPVLREIEVTEPRTVLKEVQYTEVVPVIKHIEVCEPVVVMKEIETVEPCVVTKYIKVIENVAVKKLVEVVEMVHETIEVEQLEPQTFRKEVEVIEQVPVKRLVEVSEPVTVTKAVEFVEPLITTQTITKELIEPVVVDKMITTEVGPATLVGVQGDVEVRRSGELLGSRLSDMRIHDSRFGERRDETQNYESWSKIDQTKSEYRKL